MPKKEVKKEKSLTKKEIVSCLAEDTGLGKNEVETFFDKLFDLIVDEARAGITIPGICKISLKDRAARIGRNPATGATMKIPAKQVVKAKLLKGLKESILPSTKIKKKKK